MHITSESQTKANSCGEMHIYGIRSRPALADRNLSPVSISA